MRTEEEWRAADRANRAAADAEAMATWVTVDALHRRLGELIAEGKGSLVVAATTSDCCSCSTRPMTDLGEITETWTGANLDENNEVACLALDGGPKRIGRPPLPDED